MRDTAARAAVVRAAISKNVMSTQSPQGYRIYKPDPYRLVPGTGYVCAEMREYPYRIYTTAETCLCATFNSCKIVIVDNQFARNNPPP